MFIEYLRCARPRVGPTEGRLGLASAGPWSSADSSECLPGYMGQSVMGSI
jgi:hypothetical protein